MPDEDGVGLLNGKSYPHGGKSSLEKFITGAVLVVVLGIVAFLMFDHFGKTSSRRAEKYKYAITTSSLGNFYTAGVPELIGGGCIRFKDEEDKLRVVCGDVSLREL